MPDKLPLSGVKVVEFAGLAPGPFAGRKRKKTDSTSAERSCSGPGRFWRRVRSALSSHYLLLNKQHLASSELPHFPSGICNGNFLKGVPTPNLPILRLVRPTNAVEQPKDAHQRVAERTSVLLACIYSMQWCTVSTYVRSGSVAFPCCGMLGPNPQSAHCLVERA